MFANAGQGSTQFAVPSPSVSVSATPQPQAKDTSGEHSESRLHWLWGTMRRFVPYYRSAMIAALLDEQDRIEADATEAFHRGRKEALFEIGGKELVDAVERGDAANSEICLKKAYASLAAKEAELKAMSN